MKKFSFSKICIVIFFFYWIFSFFQYDRIHKNPIAWDVISFYDYVPATFICHDLTLHFTDKDSTYFGMKVWYEHAPNGARVIKTSMGVAYLCTPFFCIGHLYAKISAAVQDGYSLPYQVALQFGTLFYVIIGFIFLRKLLLRYFSDNITALTIFSIFFGTNLLFYATGSLMAHAYLFSILCIYLFVIDNWHKNPSVKNSIFMGLLGRLLALMKPTMIVCVFIPLFWAVSNLESLKEKINFIGKKKWKVLLIIFFFILPAIPQLFYWKYITGHWFFFSYTNERFFFDHPQILKGWFSYRNGWLLYTPIMIFSLAGFFFMKQKLRHMILPFILFFLSTTYLVESWWCWWHGGYGLRAYVETYPVMAFPMATFYDFFMGRKIYLRASIFVLSLLLIALNIFQEWQFENNLIHFAGMTKKSYWLGFLKIKVDGVWWECLQDADIGSALKGLPEYVGEAEREKNAKREIKIINDFENIPDDNKSKYYSSEIYKSKSYSMAMRDTNLFSPSVTLLADQIIDDSVTDKKWEASVQFYCKEKNIKPREGILVLRFEDNSGIYFYKEMDFYAFDSEPDNWNKAFIQIPKEEIKSKDDKIDRK